MSRLASGTRLSHLALLLLFAVASASRAEAPPRSSVLSEGWLFQPDPLAVGDREGWEKPGFDRAGWRPVAVPGAWDFYSPVMDGYEGVGWFALRLPAERVVPGAWQRLRFGRANYRAVVFLDGQRLGENADGYLPFEFALTPRLEPGRPSWIVVRVGNGAAYDRLPGSTIVEWVQYGGLLQPVELLTTAPAHIAHVTIRATPRGNGGAVTALVELENAAGTAFAGLVRIEVDGGKGEAPVRVAPRARAEVALELDLPGARLWSPESPALYEARIALAESGREIDTTRERFGVRSIAARGREILLNGRPLHLRGVNRYDEFAGRGPVVDRAAIRDDLQAVKAAGANFIRVHYPQTPETLDLADELGLLFMEEVPLNWWRAAWHPPVPPEFANDRIIDAAERALVGMVRRDVNHPSLLIWSVANECETSDEMGSRAMERLLARARALDPTRLVTYVANRKFAEQRAFAGADLVAVNLYFGMWGGETAENLGDIEKRVYEPTRAALAEILGLFPGKPLVLSEFGTIGLVGSGGDVRFSEEYQAAYVAAVWRALQAVPEVAGGAVWAWADYRHRRGFTNDYPAEFGPFGLVGLDRRPKKALAALQDLWQAQALAAPP